MERRGLSPGQWAFIGIFLALIIFFSVDSFFSDYSTTLLLQFVETLKSFNIFIDIIIYWAFSSLALSLACPTGILAISGGYLFTRSFEFGTGVILSTLINIAANGTACLIAFPLSIFVFGDSVIEYSNDHILFKNWEKAMCGDGLYLNVLVRLSPIFPVVFLNYTLPLLGTPLSDFILGCMIGVSPYALIFSLLGSFLADSSNNISLISDHMWVVEVGGIMLMIITIVLLYQYTTHALTEAFESVKGSNEDAEIKESPSVTLVDENTSLLYKSI